MKNKKTKTTREKLKTNAKSVLRNNVAVSKSRRKNVHIRKKNFNKKRKYSDQDIQQALQALASGKSLRAAGNAHGVPAATLYRKKKFDITTCITSGPKPKLSQEDEEKIAQWIIYSAQRGSPVNKTELLDSVQYYVTNSALKTPFVNNRPGRHWYESFLKRHPNISMRTAQNLTTTRATVSEEDIKDWFMQVECHLCSKDLLNIEASRVFNCDETSIQLCPKPEKVLAEKGASSVYKIVQPNEKESVTCLIMYSADGRRAPTLVMFPYKEKIPKSIVQKCPRDFGIGCSDKGWMTIESFFEYITLIFYPWLIDKKIQFPVVIYFDGHASHMTIPLVHFCQNKQIELISLYPNATHVIQPLDISFFHPFKDSWRRFLAQWKKENNKKILTREDFATVLKLALDGYSQSSETIIQGFKAAGLMPLNPNAPEYNVLDKKKKKKKNKENVQPVEEIQINNQINNDVMIDKKRQLQDFESNLSSQLLQEFKENSNSTVWTGEIEQDGLFHYWLKLKNETYESSENSLIQTIHRETNLIQSSDSFNEKQPVGLNFHSLLPIEVINTICAQETDQINNLYNENVIVINTNTMCGAMSGYDGTVIAVLDLSSSLEKEIPNDLPIIVLNNEEKPLVASSISQTHNIEPGLNVSINNTINEKTVDRSDESLSINAFILKEVGNRQALQNNSQFNTVDVDRVDKNTESQKENNNFEDSNSKFEEAFVLPMEYLPKKKKLKLETKGKKKLPAVGTSEAWMKILEEQEKEKKMKEEKLAKRKELQTAKKKIAEEKKKLDQRMREIALRIKQEKM